MISNVQAVIFKKNKYTPEKAREWLKKRKYKPIKRAHITNNYVRYRIREPDYNKYIYRTLDIGHGVKLIYFLTKEETNYNTLD